MERKRNYKIIQKLILISILLVFLFSVGCSENLLDSEQDATKIIENTKSNTDGELKIHFLDVGQADCILIQESTGKNMLIDAGNNGDADFINAYLKQYNIKSLDYLILTHPHEDHIGSADVVLSSFDVDTVLIPDVSKNTKTFKDVIEAIDNRGPDKINPNVGDEYSLGQAKFTILAPNSSDYDDTNDYSIVIKLQYGNNSFILTGDAETESEHEMVASGLDLKADLLKVSHHGSGTSTTAEFLYKVSPKFAIISVGTGNKYGHPDDIIINRLDIQGVEVYRTDEVGTIIAVSDGTNITIDKNASVIEVNAPPEATTDTTKVDNEEEQLLSNGVIEIIDIDKKAEYVLIQNNSNVDMDITGWKIVSVNGGQTFIFPNFILKVGEVVKIAGYDARDSGDFIWEDGGGIWNNSKDDQGELYDLNNNIISRY